MRSLFLLIIFLYYYNYIIIIILESITDSTVTRLIQPIRSLVDSIASAQSELLQANTRAHRKREATRGCAYTCAVATTALGPPPPPIKITFMGFHSPHYKQAYNGLEASEKLRFENWSTGSYRCERVRLTQPRVCPRRSLSWPLPRPPGWRRARACYHRGANYRRPWPPTFARSVRRHP